MCPSVFDDKVSLRVLSKEHLMVVILHQRSGRNTSHTPGCSGHVALIFERTSHLQTSVRDHPEALRVLGEQRGKTVIVICFVVELWFLQWRSPWFCPLKLWVNVFLSVSLTLMLHSLFQRINTGMHKVFLWGQGEWTSTVFLLSVHHRWRDLFQGFLSWSHLCISQVKTKGCLTLETVRQAWFKGT